MKAYDVGLNDALAGKLQKRGRAYETDKANDAYYAGFAAGIKRMHPSELVVKCTRDFTIFAAAVSSSITCPTCARRFILNENGDYESDRVLEIIYSRGSND